MSAKRLQIRANRWIRQKDELAIAISLADYPALKRKKSLQIDPGTAAVLYLENGGIAFQTERHCQIHSSTTHIMVIYCDPFFLTLDHPDKQIILKLRFQKIRSNQLAEFSQKLRLLLNQRSQIFIDDIYQNAMGFVIPRISKGISDDDLSSQKYELIRFFEQFALDVDEIEIIPKAPAQSILCAVSQNANIGHLVVLSGIDSSESMEIPLKDGEYLIGRTHNRQTLLSVLGSNDNSEKKAIWFPKKPGPSTLIRVGRVRVKDNQTTFYPGWPAHHTREKIMCKDRFAQFNHELLNSTPYLLKGFERLCFEGSPKIELLYVPPVTDTTRALFTQGILIELESFGLWANAAYGWENIGDYKRALVDLERALDCAHKGSSSQIEQANILMAMARVMMNSSSIPQDIGNVQKQAFNLLNLPVLEVYVRGKVGIQEKPLRLGLFIHNKSTHQTVHDIQIIYHCGELGIYQSFTIEDIAPRHEVESGFWIPGLTKYGKFPVKITIEFSAPSRDIYELWFTDFVEITKRRSRIDVEGDTGVVSVKVEDQDSIPDIRVGRDAGAIFVKLVNKGM